MSLPFLIDLNDVEACITRHSETYIITTAGNVIDEEVIDVPSVPQRATRSVQTLLQFISVSWHYERHRVSYYLHDFIDGKFDFIIFRGEFRAR